MNTLEVKIKGLIKSFDDLYKYAYKQFLEYEKLEGIENWKEYDFSIDCSEDQMKFKDMLQIRCIEELTEATHALDDENHFFEEVTDSLNFFLSAYCMLGVDFKLFENPERILSNNYFDYVNLKDIRNIYTIKIGFYSIVNDIGDICNLLKNRPWTQSNYLVSMLDFNERLPWTRRRTATPSTSRFPTSPRIRSSSRATSPWPAGASTPSGTGAAAASTPPAPCRTGTRSTSRWPRTSPWATSAC